MNILAELRVHNFYCSDTPAGIKDVRVELQKVVKLQTVKMYWIIFFLKVKIVHSVSPFREKVPVSQVLVFWYCLVFCHFLLLHTCYNYIQQAAGLQHLGPSLLRPLLPFSPSRWRFLLLGILIPCIKPYQRLDIHFSPQNDHNDRKRS